jgi:hypothetical protein
MQASSDEAMCDRSACASGHNELLLEVRSATLNWILAYC